MKVEKSKFMSKEERKLLFNLIEKYHNILYGKSSKTKGKAWEVITRDFNNSGKGFHRTTQQLKKFWGNVKVKLKKQLSVGGIATIYTLPPHEIRPLGLIPPDFFADVVHKEEFKICLSEAGIKKGSKGKHYDSSDEDLDDGSNEVINEVVMEDECGFSVSHEDLCEQENPLAITTTDQSSIDEQINLNAIPGEVSIYKPPQKNNISSNCVQSNAIDIKAESTSDSEDTISLPDMSNVSTVTEIDIDTSQAEPARQLSRGVRQLSAFRLLPLSASVSSNNVSTMKEDVMDDSDIFHTTTGAVEGIQHRIHQPVHIFDNSLQTSCHISLPTITNVQSLASSKEVDPEITVDGKTPYAGRVNYILSTGKDQRRSKRLNIKNIPKILSPASVKKSNSPPMTKATASSVVLPDSCYTDEYLGLCKEALLKRIKMEEAKFCYEMENLRRERKNREERHEMEMNLLRYKLDLVSSQHVDYVKKRHSKNS